MFKTLVALQNHIIAVGYLVLIGVSIWGIFTSRHPGSVFGLEISAGLKLALSLFGLLIAAAIPFTFLVVVIYRALSVSNK